MRKQALWIVRVCLLTVFMGGVVSAVVSPMDQARALFEDQQYDRVITLAEKEIKKNGEGADLLVLMADSYLAMGKVRKAEKTYRRALALDRRHVDGNLNLAMLLVAERERKEAIALIKGVLAKYPDHARAHFCLGLAFNARADINDAFAQYKILKKLDAELAAELYNVIFSK